jgi:hypothetical protein
MSCTLNSTSSPDDDDDDDHSSRPASLDTRTLAWTREHESPLDAPRQRRAAEFRRTQPEHRSPSGSDDDDGDDDDDDEFCLVPPPPHRSAHTRSGAPPPPPQQQIVVGGARRVDGARIAPCALCYEELPFFENLAVAATTSDKAQDMRAVIFRLRRLLRGNVHEEVVYAAMLQLRRQLIEVHLEKYSTRPFQRWSIEMLREHYHPVHGHVRDAVSTLDAAIARLEALGAAIDEHALYVRDDADPGSPAKFNLRAVEFQLRTTKTLLDTLRQKATTMRGEALEHAGDATAVLDAIHTSSALVSSTSAPVTRKRARADSGVGGFYDLGGL